MRGFTIKGAVYGAIVARLVRVSSRVSTIVGLGYLFASNDIKAKCLCPLVRTLLRFALKSGLNKSLFNQQHEVQGYVLTSAPPKAPANPAQIGHKKAAAS